MNEKTSKALRRSAKKNANRIVEKYMEKNSQQVIGATVDVLAAQPLKTRLSVIWILLKGKRRNKRK